MEKPQKQKHESGDELITLEDIFNFDANDLMANRSGVLSSRQKLLLHQQYNRDLTEAMVVILVIAVPLIIVTVLLQLQGTLFQFAWIIIGFAIVIYFLWRRAQIRNAIQTEQVDSAEGNLMRSLGSTLPHDTSQMGEGIRYPRRRMRFPWWGWGGMMHQPHVPRDAQHQQQRYFLRVDEIELPINASAYWNLEAWEDEYVFVYYVPNTLQILSLEVDVKSSKAKH